MKSSVLRCVVDGWRLSATRPTCRTTRRGPSKNYQLPAVFQFATELARFGGRPRGCATALVRTKTVLRLGLPSGQPVVGTIGMRASGGSGNPACRRDTLAFCARNQGVGFAIV